MLEDVLYEVLPVIGFAICASSVLVLVVMRRAADAFQFTVWFAAIDLLTGLATLYAGFYGIFSTIYGRTGEVTTPFKCLSEAVHVSLWLFLDMYNMMLLSLFCFDRLLFMVVPVSYIKASRLYLNWPFILFLGVVSGVLVTPAFSLSVESYRNESILIPAFCRLDFLTGWDYYDSHSRAMQWMPIGGMGCIALALVLFGIRALKQRWLYNWSEEAHHSKQLFVAAFLRCFLMTVAVNMPLLLVFTASNSMQLLELRDVLVRIPLYTVVCVLQPLWYVMVMPEFCNNAGLLFNQYGHNTERKWQSADDPPAEVEHKDRFGDENPFGSWYSSAGNVTGEAGLPIGNERSVSFYYDKM